MNGAGKAATGRAQGALWSCRTWSGRTVRGRLPCRVRSPSFLKRKQEGAMAPSLPQRGALTPAPLSLDGLCYSLVLIRHGKAEELGDQSLVAMRFLLFCKAAPEWPPKSRQGSGFCCSTYFLSEHIHTLQRPEDVHNSFWYMYVCSVCSWACTWRSGIPLHDSVLFL